MPRPRILQIAAVATVALILLYGFWPASAPDIPTAKVSKGRFDIVVIESGSVRARNSSTVTAPRLLTGGALQVVFLAPEGTIAKKEDVLIRFDPSNALKRIADKETELKTALADMAKMKAQQSADQSQAATDFETAKLNFQLAEIARDRMQYEPEAKRREAELEFERAKLAFQQSKLAVENKTIVRKSELGNLQLKINQIRSDIAASTREMEQLTVKAPISGLIVYENNWSTGRKISVGDQPWPGMPLISLPDLSSIQVEVSINEMNIAKVRTGQQVKVTPDAFPDKSFAGTISTVSQIGHEKGSGSNVKVFDIVVDIAGTDEVLKPGITTTNRIIIGSIKDAVSIPIVAVSEDGRKTHVYVRSGGGFDKREVTLGERNDNFVIVKKGVSAGEEVALRNPEKSAEEEKNDGDEAATRTASTARKP